MLLSDRRSGGPTCSTARRGRAHLADLRPEAIYHLAAQASVPTSWSDPAATVRTNVEGTLNVLLAAAGTPACAGCCSCPAPTSTATPPRPPLREDTPLRR